MLVALALQSKLCNETISYGFVVDFVNRLSESGSDCKSYDEGYRTYVVVVGVY